jgi:uncharacterized protein YndB with AHSA1/START domain
MLPILLAIVFIALIFFLIIAGQPDQFTISRATTISAPPEKIFPRVNDLHQWDQWSPWAKLDPNAKNSFAGPVTGIGATMTWAGNKKVGEGRMTITESQPSDLIRLRLEFLKPFTATNAAEFNFAARRQQTMVTWSMTGKNNFKGKVLGLLMNCDQMIGGDFERGLANLKVITETGGGK